MRTLGIPVLTGLGAFGGGMFLNPNSSATIPGLGRISSPVAMGVVAGVSALLAQLAGNYVLPWIIPKLGSYAQIGERLGGPVLTGAMNVLVSMYTDSNGTPVANFAVGAASYFLATYLYDTFWR